jgi:adenine-specific DNA-methyltransferase
MNVFIGGSRAVPRLNAPIRDRIDDLLKRGSTILVGDANGADKAVQQYLADRQYTRVIVFCMERRRNNIGAWPTRNVDPPSERRGFTYYPRFPF